MTATILPTHKTNLSSSYLSLENKSSSKAVNFANIICSRESTYRTMLDLTAFDFPIIFASAFRNLSNFIESAFECFYGTAILFFSPLVTSLVGDKVGSQIFSGEEKKDIPMYLKFSMSDVKSKETLKDGLRRIADEEVKDKNFIATIFGRANKQDSMTKYVQEANDITDFCDRFVPTDEMAKKITQLKKRTILVESFIEGSWAASTSFATRMFRKYILHEDRFTGTKGYLSDSESTSLGEGEDISLIQKVGGVALCGISPLVNHTLLSITDDDEAVKKSKLKSMLREQIDMTHGVYPKLGLLLFSTMPSKWTGTILFAQGGFERGERILKFLTVVMSWWFGHRFTNGLMAKRADEELAKKYNIDKGILIDKEYYDASSENENIFIKLKNKYPEPAKINDVFKAVDESKLDGAGKEKLMLDAEEKHAECLYKGFALHSAIVWGMNMVVNQITKFRAVKSLSA